MLYSMKENKSVFIPCCGKHRDHETIKNSWGKYVNNFKLRDTLGKDPDILIEGYTVYDINEFDRYILKMEPGSLNLKYIGHSGVLLGELWDYLNSFALPREESSKLVLRYSSGRELIIEK